MTDPKTLFEDFNRSSDLVINFNYSQCSLFDVANVLMSNAQLSWLCTNYTASPETPEAYEKWANALDVFMDNVRDANDYFIDDVTKFTERYANDPSEDNAIDLQVMLGAPIKVYSAMCACTDVIMIFMDPSRFPEKLIPDEERIDSGLWRFPIYEGVFKQANQIMRSKLSEDQYDRIKDLYLECARKEVPFQSSAWPYGE